MLLLFEEAGNKIAFLKVMWELDENDYARFDRELTALTDAHGQIRVLILLDGFRTPDPLTFMESMGFDLKYPDNIERIAFVSDFNPVRSAVKKGDWKNFVPHSLRFFSLSEADQARQWVAEAATQIPSASRRLQPPRAEKSG